MTTFKKNDIVTEKSLNHGIKALILNVFNHDPENNKEWFAEIEYNFKNRTIKTILPTYRLKAVI